MSANYDFLHQGESEADTCRDYVLPKLQASGWEGKILEQRSFTDGKIIVAGRKAKRGERKRFDYLLRYSQSFPIAIVEAKRSYKNAADGMGQAKEYAQILDLKFAYATNGKEILEFDFITGLETKISVFPSPEILWQRLNAAYPIQPQATETFLKPFFPTQGKELRYYQRNAINAATKAILEGRRRALLTLATGTGKTTVAFQIIYKLWNNRWNVKGEHRRPKVLFIADRGILVSDPHAKDFAIFGDARCLVPEEGLPSSREIYFSTYQSLAEDESRVGAFRSLPRDFFDLIVIDECHRGSASDDSNWRAILNYFECSVKLGLTATPLRDDNIDSYAYFGNPLYTYSLRQGIEDGFLAPYLLHRIVAEPDATGWRPEDGQLDANGQLIPDEVYNTSDFENTLSHLPRTKAVVKHLYNFMVRNGRWDKTIVFCVNQEHADHFRREFNNQNADLTSQHPNYIVRIVSDEGDIGKGHLGKFMDVDEAVPVVVTTSRLLTTGVDVQTCKNVVLFRDINSQTEFKQIIGRGTRVREDYGKMFFTILDYTGSASRRFADPDFDGYPPFISVEDIDEDGNVTGSEQTEGGEEGTEINTSSDDNGTQEPPAPPQPPQPPVPPPPPRRKYYVEEGEVNIVAETVQIIDAATGKLRTVEFTHFAQERITSLYPSVDGLRTKWSNANDRQQIIDELERSGISLEQLGEITKQPDADPFDLLCFVAYNMKPLTRAQRASLARKNKPDFFSQYGERARAVLEGIIEKYVLYGPAQIRPNIISVAPINENGNQLEIVNAFGGYDAFTSAIDNLQRILYTA